MLIGLILVLFFIGLVISVINVLRLNKIVDLPFYLSLLFKEINITTVWRRFLTFGFGFMSNLKSTQILNNTLPSKGDLVKSHCPTV